MVNGYTVSKLFIFRGLPGSGKTTAAKRMQSFWPENTVRVNRDDTRKRLFGSDDQDYYACDKQALGRKESLVTQANKEAILAALKAGMHVIVDDTNLPVSRCRELIRLANAAQANWEVREFDTHLEVCIERNATRTDKQPVPEDVIRRMHTQFFNPVLSPVPNVPDMRADDYSEIIPAEPYSRRKRNCYIFDIDGTIAQMTGRSPYDYSRVSEDVPKADVVRILETLYNPEAGVDVILVSGRKAECRDQTVDWLYHHEIPVTRLYMRADGDDRPDWIVKYELFNNHLRERYNVLGVFDDRNQVVKMWRALGLTCLQVAEGDF